MKSSADIGITADMPWLQLDRFITQESETPREREREREGYTMSSSAGQVAREEDCFGIFGVGGRRCDICLDAKIAAPYST